MEEILSSPSNSPSLPRSNKSSGSNATSMLPRYNRSAKRPQVYITRRIPQKGMDILLGACDVKMWDAEEPVPRGELLNMVVGVDGIFCMQGDTIDADVLVAAGPGLQVVATTASSKGHIDVTECQARGVQVLTCPDQPSENLADLTVALVLLTIKETQTEEERLVNFNLIAPDVIPTLSTTCDGGINNTLEILTNARFQSRPNFIKRMSEERLAFQWNRGRPGNANSPTWRNIVNRRFGIYGLTQLGVSVAQLLNSLGAAGVMVADQSCEGKSLVDMPVGNGSVFEMVSFDELLEKSDVICVCDPSSMSETAEEDDDDESVFCKEAFEKMKPGAILVSSQSHQAAVDYLELYAALRDGKIRAAGLNDVNQEPVPLKALLLSMNNCVFLPQTQESVYDMRHQVSVLIAQKLTKALSMTQEKTFYM
ncbi:glyoxylate reductase/hydroxypyruvate reductase [Plakobranchus ocellatus]|uniref:Glyoxylate reductase/hydroxypyruvate reductase n=1 Tax=Plakobranchus ocellatus TaxID=259542 RepID=A0AAV4AP53_9GAST|nr:glyoxylate reductase/hydroxypyruvate reductase [Plakobranchus ocellatus]